MTWQKQYGESKYTKDKIISCIDPDSRVVHKTRTKTKTGYKDHIIVNEENEIILGSEQTPFNVNDDKRLIDLIEKVDNNFNLNPDEISADKAYGTVNNRAYLKDNNMKTNIACNIIRMVALIFNNHQPSFTISKIE